METVNRGFQRLANFRSARVHFLREYTGQYYDNTSGEIGTHALNFIFNAIRVLLPTMVMNFPKHTLTTPYLATRQYADLLGLALDQHDMKIDVRNVYRRVIVDAIFTLGILKTGLAQSNSVYALDDQDHVDVGTVYTEAVDFDNFVVDPNSKDHMFRDAAFMGDRITVPRQMLLDSGLYDNDLVERLPRAGDVNKQRKAFSLSMQNIDIEENFSLEDDVEIVELWVPSANAIVTVPGSDDVTFDDYLRVDDYYGVKEGPYTLLSLTPPVPGNPLPVPTVGIWYDLHVLANRMAKKIIEQAERQKDIVTYRRAASEDAEELKNAGDGEAVAVEDPDAVNVMHFGGQQNSNETHLAQLQGWFNMMAANPEQVGGQQVNATSATAANILQQNASIGLEDMKDLVYQMAASEARKRCWYFHTDPLMNIPLTRRQQQNTPVQMQTPMGPQWMLMPQMQDVQIILTPEARRGDFLDFTFNIEPESMGRRDSKTRLAQAMAFAQQIMPAVMAAAQIAGALGIPFSVQNFLLRMAKDSGIEWMDEVLFDPNYQQQLQMQMMMGPQAAQSKGQPGPPQQPAEQQQPNGGLNSQMMQNGQPSSVMGAPPTEQQQFNQGSQEGAFLAQRELKSAVSRALTPPRPDKYASILQ
jgi:hypothetical protein